MSTTIDSKVVEMKFDNKQFESGVQTSMSTLQKLKQSLNLTGASKGLESINTAAKNVNMNGLGTAVDSVSMKFSALQVMGVTALTNITNQAVNAGKRIVSALTIDPVKTGFQEYETQMNAVQTIYSNTKSKGSTLDDVNAALDKLNTYADQTIYNFTEMTRNIGTFTAAGVDLQTSVDSIKGIANLAAVSGSSSQQASTAMYQLSQALAAGKVSLMDWNSVVNAGMGGELFQNALIRTSELLKTGAKDAIATYGSFRESLTQGEWLTTEVLTETLKQLSGAYTEAELVAQGFTESQAKEIATLAQDASDAATKVKTFTQLWDVLKESAQSGWSQTWKLIVGDFEEAKSLLTPLSETLTGFINKMSDLRNRIVEGVVDFAAPWKTIMDKLGGSGFGKIAETVENVTHKLEDFQEIVNKVWRGDYGNGEYRFNLLDTEGWDHRVVQDLVNKGYDYKITMEDVEASHRKFGLTMEQTTESTEKSAEATETATNALANLSDEELKNAGLTQDEIDLFRALEKEAEATGTTIEKLAKEMSENNGRDLLIESFKNIGGAISDVASIAKDAWVEILDPPNSGEIIVKLYGMIAALNEFTDKLKLFTEEGDLTETGDKILRTFKGIFAAVDIVATIFGGGLRIAFNVLKEILKAFDMDVLDLTANIGDAIVKFRDWFDSVLDISGAIDWLLPYVTNFVNKIQELFTAIKGSGEFSDFVQTMKDLGASIKEWFLGIRGTDNVGAYIIQGLANGITSGVSAVWDAIVTLATGLIAKFCEVFGINSPSTVFIALGGFLIAGLCLGLQNGFSSLWETIESLGSGCFEGLTGLVTNLFNFLGTVDFGTLFGGGLSVGVVAILWKIASAFQNVTEFVGGLGGTLDGVGEVLEGTGRVLKKAARPIKRILNNTAKVVKSFANVMNGVALQLKAKAIRDLAVSLLIIVGAVAALAILNSMGVDLWNAVGVVAVLAGVLAVLAFAVSKMSSASATIGKDGAKISGVTMSIIGIGTAILLVAIAVKKIGEMDPDQMQQGLNGLAGVLLTLVAVIGTFAIVSKAGSAEHIGQFGGMMLKMSVAILIMVGVAKLIGGMEWSELGKAGAFIGAFAAFVLALSAISLLVSKNLTQIVALSVLGSTMKKISVSLLLMAVAAKLIATMEWGDLGKAGAFAAGFIAFVALLATISMIPGKTVEKLGGMLLMISGALLILTVIAKMIGEMSWYQMGKAAAGLIGLVGVVALLTWIASIPGVGKVGPTLLALSGAIAILAITGKLLATMSWDEITRASAGLLAFSIIIGILVGIVDMAGGDAPKIAGTLIALSGAIAILAIIAVALGFVKLENLAKGIIAVGLLSGMMTAMIWATRGANDCKANLIVMTVAIGLMAAAIGVLSFIDPVKLAGATIAMGLLMGIFTILVKVAGTVKGSIGTLIVMTVAVGLLAGVLYLLSTLPVESTIGSAEALSALLLAMSVALAILSVIGAIGTSALIGVLALTAMVVPMLAFVGVLAIMQNIQNATENTKLLVGLATTMTVLLVALAIVGPLAMGGVAALAALTLVIVAIGALAVGIGALMTEFPALQEFLDTGISVLQELAYGLGSVISSFGEGLTSGLPDIGANLSAFITNAMPFITGIKMVDATAIEGAKNLAGAIVALTGAELLAGIASFLSGGVSLAQLGSDLSAFMINAMPFIMMANMIDPAMPASVEALASAIKSITSASLLENITSWLTGGNSMATFGTQLAELGTSLNTFVTNLGTFDESKVTTVTCAANAVKALAQAADTIPNEGGWAAKIFGENSLATFGAQLGLLGVNLNTFVTNLGTFDESKVATVTCAGNAIKALAEAASTIPNEGGWAAKIFGDNSLATFGGQLGSLGTNLSLFVTNLGTFSEDQVNTVTCAGNAIKALATAASSIDGQADWAKKIFGDNGLSAFGDEMASLGTDLSAFAENLGTFGEDKIASIDAAVRAVKAFAALNGVDMDDLPDFGEGVVDIGEDIASFCEGMPSSEAITTAIDNLKKVVNCITDVGSGSSAMATDFTSSLEQIGEDGVDAFISAFEDAEADAKEAGKKLMDQVVDGIETKAGDVGDACSDAASDGVDDIESQYDDFYGAGEYLVEGFAAGITANTWLAEAKARAMANAAEAAAEAALGINSPSRVFYKIGSFTGMGFVNALGDYAGKVYKAAGEMAASAKSGLSRAISRINDFIAGDMDTQPTIRPILDLTDIRNGSRTIADMLAMGSSPELLTNIGTISSTMNQRNQNGANFEIVSAINKLRKDLGKVGGNTTNYINGVTYDDGSNITEAVKTLVHAAKVERRV